MNIQHLYHVYSQSTGVSIDTRTLQRGNLFFSLNGENFNGGQFVFEALEKGAKFVITDDRAHYKANNEKIIYLKDALVALQTLATYHRGYFSCPIIAITGSNGKTTTKELLVRIFSKNYKTYGTKGNLNNHIGLPLTLLSLPLNAQMVVLEMGASHKKEIGRLCQIAQPDFGCITNFGSAHLEGFGSIEGVVEGKSELYEYLKTYNKVAFVNADDDLQMEKSLGLTRYTFSTKKGSDMQINHLKASLPKLELFFNHTEIHSKMLGSYNLFNISIAVAIGNYFNLPSQSIKEAIEGYNPENNRSQIIQKNQLKIFLDAYNANPTSMREAVSSFKNFKGNKLVILGDMFELGEYSKTEHQEIINLLEGSNIKLSYVVGENFYNTKVSTSRIVKFVSLKLLKEHLKDNPLADISYVLIKGSRKMALENILDLID